MVLLRINKDYRTYIYENCDNTITSGQEYFIDPASNPNFRYTFSGNKIYYICRCGTKHELIKDPNPKVPNALKFKYITIINQE